MLLEGKHKSKSQYKEISFNGEAEEEFEKYIDFLYTNSERFQDEVKDKNEDEIKEIEERWKGKLENELKDKLERTFNHKKSIYPDNSEYGIDNMLVNTTNQRVIFYEIIKDGDDSSIKIHKCPHYEDFINELKEKKIEPKKNADPYILLDLLKLEYHNEVKKSGENGLSKEVKEEFNKREKELKDKCKNWNIDKDSKNKDSKEPEKSKESEGKKEKITDPKTGKKIKKVKHTGPRGGHYYINNKGKHIYPEEWNESIKNMKSVKSYITESKMVSLIEYLKKMVG